MADENHTPPLADGKPADPTTHIEIEARRVVAEITVLLESVAGGLEALQRLPEAVLITTQLGVLRDLVTLAVQTVEAFAGTLGQTT